MRGEVVILGVTGGIAAGKSLVVEMFRSLGAAVVSADDLAREAVAPGSEALQRLVAQFGAGVLQPDGTLDRPALAAIVFADAEARQRLNRIVHPAIARLAEKRLAELARQPFPLIVYEAPLLFEAGAEDRVDAVLVVTIDPDRQLERLMARDQLSPDQARLRIAAQMSQAEKVARADLVLDNSADRQLTARRVAALFRQLTASPLPLKRPSQDEND